jgi:hypothetical protein
VKIFFFSDVIFNWTFFWGGFPCWENILLRGFVSNLFFVLFLSFLVFALFLPFFCLIHFRSLSQSFFYSFSLFLFFSFYRSFELFLSLTRYGRRQLVIYGPNTISNQTNQRSVFFGTPKIIHAIKHWTSSCPINIFALVWYDFMINEKQPTHFTSIIITIQIFLFKLDTLNWCRQHQRTNYLVVIIVR